MAENGSQLSKGLSGRKLFAAFIVEVRRDGGSCTKIHLIQSGVCDGSCSVWVRGRWRKLKSRQLQGGLIPILLCLSKVIGSPRVYIPSKIL